MASKNYKEIPLAALRTGMTVVKLDISWLDSPFLTHTRKIKGEQDINALRNAGVKKVVVDLDKSPKFEAEHIEQESRPLAKEITQHKERATLPQDATREPEVGEPPQQPLQQPFKQQAPLPGSPQEKPPAARTSVQEELKAALSIRKHVKDAVSNLQKSFENETPISSKELVPLIDDTLRSLERNSQALLSLVHLSRKSQKLAEHTFGCFCLVLNLALKRNANEEERELLGLAALLHEAGWVQIPLQLMGKRKVYSSTEKKLVEKHIQLAEKILSQSEIPPVTLRIVAEHHEHLDGSGYPKGLKGDQMHPLTSLLSVVDTYEERVHQLTDQPGMTPTNAIRSIYVDAEKGHYDAEVAATFISMLGIYPVMTAVKLSSGELGLIREQHEEAPLYPTVELHYNAAGKTLTPSIMLDLREQPEGEKRTILSAIDPHDTALDPSRRLLPEADDII